MYQQDDPCSHSITELLHVHDLPQLYTRPSFQQLHDALDLLQLQPTSFLGDDPNSSLPRVDPEGVPHYLTLIVSSSLSWLKNDDEREQILDLASARLSERAGRNAMPDITRSFRVSASLVINLFEPSLTEDNLGLKTWTSSLLLARRLPELHHHVPPSCPQVLELGSGTGLVGIAAAALWDVSVILSDLPEIVSNLQSNVDSNVGLLDGTNGSLRVQSIDWSKDSDAPRDEHERFGVILAADPIYSLSHPAMLVDAMHRWIKRESSSRFIVELPLRKGYEKERKVLREKLHEAGMVMIEEGAEVGYDDWQGNDGRPAEVECWWSVWRPSL